MKYQCSKCGHKLELDKATIAVIDGKIATREAYCEKCKRYMEKVREFKGWGGIVSKPGGIVG